VGTYLGVEPYSAKRFFSFLHPIPTCSAADTNSSSHESDSGRAASADWASVTVARSGDFFQTRHTDFIFTIVGEELGIIGSLAVIALFVAFLMVSVRIARQCSNQCVPAHRCRYHDVDHRRSAHQYLVGGGWWAVTGVPLPFFSYGGTALITELAAVGLLYNIAHDRSRSGDLTIRDNRLTSFRETFERPRPQRRPAQRPVTHSRTRHRQDY